MPVFTFLPAFIGLLAVPALIAIYWLRNRAREHRVSSLLLWLAERQVREGGRKIERLQTPLLFFLELLLILLLVTAAAGPLMQAQDDLSPLVVVLDDSFSMLAGVEDRARTRAAKAIEKELRANRYDSVRFILAAEAPQLLGEATSRADQAVEWLKEWRCGAPAADLEEAIAFAFELGRNRARLLVVTDHAPAQELSGGRIEWWAFGSQRPNVAFVNATRTRYVDEDRVLLEIANLSSQPGTAELKVDSYDSSADSYSLQGPGLAVRDPQSLSLGPNETRRMLFSLKAGSAPLRARLSNDALDVDNEVTLMPEANRLARIDLRVRNVALRAIIERALASLQDVSITAEGPALVISDAPDAPDALEANAGSREAWTLRLISEPDAASFLGPFVVDRAHPLSEGLSLGGVVWGSGKETRFPGVPIITAGNIPLLTDVERGERHELRLRLRPDLSTLQETPNWPVLIWNLIQWRMLSAPGVSQANVRLGAEVTLKVETGVESVRVIDPRESRKQLPAHDGAVAVKAEEIGLYRFDAGQSRYAVAANALRREESDLSAAATGHWGGLPSGGRDGGGRDGAAATEYQRDYRPVSWVLLLLAMMVLAAHAWLVARARWNDHIRKR